MVVPARNSPRAVIVLLDALAEQTPSAGTVEVIVVDDASSDATPDVVEADGRATLVRRTRRGGSYAARNAGLERAGADILAFTDADCRPARDWLERGLEALEREQADLAGGRIDMPLPSTPRLAELVDVAANMDQENYVTRLGFAATANLFVRRAVFDEVGRFNARLVSGGDVELVRRATAAGFRLAYAPDATVSHAPRRAGELARKSYRVGFGTGQMPAVASGPSRAWPRLWRRPSAYRPRHGLPGVKRLSANGVELGRRRLLALDLVHYGLVQLPMIAGSVAATVRHPTRG